MHIMYHVSIYVFMYIHACCIICKTTASYYFEIVLILFFSIFLFYQCFVHLQF